MGSSRWFSGECARPYSDHQLAKHTRFWWDQTLDAHAFSCHPGWAWSLIDSYLTFDFLWNF